MEFERKMFEIRNMILRAEFERKMFIMQQKRWTKVILKELNHITEYCEKEDTT